MKVPNFGPGEFSESQADISAVATIDSFHQSSFNGECGGNCDPPGQTDGDFDKTMRSKSIEVGLPLAPVTGAPFCVCDRDDKNAGFLTTKYNLKRESSHAANAVAVVDEVKSFRVGFETFDGAIDRQTESSRHG